MELRSRGLTWQTVDDEVVVLDLEGSVYLRLNGSGRILWERLAAGASADDLVDALVDRYGIDRERASSDVTSFVERLRTKGLLAG